MDIESTIIKIQTQMNELKSEVGHNCATIPYVEYTVEEFEQELETLIFGRVINNE